MLTLNKQLYIFANLFSVILSFSIYLHWRRTEMRIYSLDVSTQQLVKWIEISRCQLTNEIDRNYARVLVMEEIIEVGLDLIKCNLEPYVCNWVSKAIVTSISGDSSVEVEILHYSDDFVVANKSFDVVVNSDDPNEKVSLQLQLRKLYPQRVNPKLPHDFYFVHRLDFATSGVICLAFNKKACAAASSAFQERKTKKYYLALLRGHINKELIDITEGIGEDATEQSGNHRMCTSCDTNCILPRDAHTRMLVLQRGEYNQYPATKVLLRPITGRRHQLRVHCACIGHTIVGDYTYSNRVDVEPYRTFLHAYRLVLPNSIEPLDIRTSDPFTTESGAPEWNPLELVNILDDSTFRKLDLKSER